ncbi:MAG: hypothetical protein ACO24D_14810 [bacterium]
MAKFIPINDALKALAAAGHEVAKVSRKQDRVAGFGGPHYLIDGEWLSLTSVRAMVADLGLEKNTTVQADKPRREIEDIAEAVRNHPGCQKRQVMIGTWGQRNLHGQIVYAFRMVGREGMHINKMKTLRDIRDWAKRNGVI